MNNHIWLSLIKLVVTLQLIILDSIIIPSQTILHIPTLTPIPYTGELDISNTSGGFSYTDFSSITGLNLNSNSAQFGNELQITTNSQNRVGSVWYTTKQLIQEGFQTTFQFQITDLINSGGDGFAFVIQNNSISTLGYGGSGLGYSGIYNSLAIEFDTYKNSDEPNDNHISIQTNGTGPNNPAQAYSIGSISTISKLSDTLVHTAKIEYVPGTMSVFLDNITTPVLTTSVNLSTTLSLDNGRAFVGFTSATGQDSEYHDLLNWSFISDNNSQLAEVYLPFILYSWPPVQYTNLYLRNQTGGDVSYTVHGIGTKIVPDTSGGEPFLWGTFTVGTYQVSWYKISNPVCRNSGTNTYPVGDFEPSPMRCI